MGSPEAVLLADLLKEIDAAARLVGFMETPEPGWYSIRIETPGDVAKSLVLPKELVLRAGTNAAARRTLTNILRTELLMRRTRDTLQRSREILARAELDPVCPRCLKPIPPSESVRFKHGEVFHLQCSGSSAASE